MPLSIYVTAIDILLFIFMMNIKTTKNLNFENSRQRAEFKLYWLGDLG